MNLRSVILSVLLVSAISCTSEKAVKPPVAEKIPFEVYDGRIDYYYWFRLSDEQKSAAVPDEQTARVLAHLNAENEYTRAVLRHTEKLQEKIYNELIGRMKQNDETVPYFDNGYFYYTKYYERYSFPRFYFRRCK